VGSCTYAALLAVTDAGIKGWRSEFIIIDGQAKSASSDASLGTSSGGTGTTGFAHAIARIELPDGTQYFITWGKKFTSLDAAVKSNAAIVSYVERGRYSAYEETMSLLNDNGYVRPDKQKSEVTPGTKNTAFDDNPELSVERTPWHFPGIEHADANVLTQYASTLQMTNPKPTTLEAFTPAGGGLSKYLEKLKINGVEQYFQGKQIATRYRVTIIEATSASGVKLYFTRDGAGKITMWPSLDKAVLASRLGTRTSWEVDQVTKGDVNDGTLEAYRQHQDTVNTPSKP